MLYSQAPRFTAPLAFKSFRPRALRTCPCNFFVLCQFRTLPFSVHFFFHLNFLPFNGLRTLSQKQGGVGGFFPSWNSSLACSPWLATPHSPLSRLECADPKTASVTPLECAVPKKHGERGVPLHSLGPMPFTTNENIHPVLRSAPAHQTASPVVFLSASVPSAHRPEFPPRASAPPARSPE